MSDPRWATPERIRQLLAEDRKLKPWPLLKEHQPWHPGPGQRWWDNPNLTCCMRGFVSDGRFASHSTEQVIPRTNRNVTRKWYRSGGERGDSEAGAI